MVETGEVRTGPGGLVRAERETDCILEDFKVVITADRRVFVRGDLRGDLIETDPQRPKFQDVVDSPLRICVTEITVRWSRVTQ